MFSSEISEFRYQLTRLARQLRRISQNDPQSWSRMLVVSAIDRMGNNVTRLSWLWQKISTALTLQ